MGTFVTAIFNAMPPRMLLRTVALRRTSFTSSMSGGGDTVGRAGTSPEGFVPGHQVSVRTENGQPALRGVPPCRQKWSLRGEPAYCAHNLLQWYGSSPLRCLFRTSLNILGDLLILQNQKISSQSHNKIPLPVSEPPLDPP